MHWCLGTYASASTWIYNVTLKVAAALYSDRSVVGRFVTNHLELDILDEPAVIPIVKTHDVDAQAEMVLGQRAEVILISIRDPRDCLASLLTYQKLSFDDALGKIARSATTSARLADHPRAIVLQYEGGFYDDIGTIDQIAPSFGGQLTLSNRHRVFNQTRRGVIEALIADLDSLPTVYHHVDPLETLDLATQWHRHHAGRTGETGRWQRELTQAQRYAVEEQLRSFMQRFGYAGDQSRLPNEG
jgi:hypothetical protein